MGSVRGVLRGTGTHEVNPCGSSMVVHPIERVGLVSIDSRINVRTSIEGLGLLFNSAWVVKQ